MSDELRLRFYLRDALKAGVKPFFTESEIAQLVSETASVEEGAALGWILKAASAQDAPTTVTIGQTSETRAQATESWKMATNMNTYWLSKSGTGLHRAAATWMEIAPKEGFIGDLMDTVAALELYWSDNDISRLDPVIW